MLDQPAGDAGEALRRPDRILAVLGKAGQHRGDEHVAGGASQRIEVDMPHAAGTFPHRWD